ncbi:MAG: flavodoxin domain-containing protein [Terracidiphilus sp.]
MLRPILVAYSTCTGSTGEVAEFIAGEFRHAGLDVEVARMCDLNDFRRYSAAILGAPIYLGKLPAETGDFLKRYRSHIALLPTWFYALGPIRGKPWEYRNAREHALSWLKDFPWLEVENFKIFGGRFNPKQMPFPYNLATQLPASPLKGHPMTDVRNWKDIRAWASSIEEEYCRRYNIEGLTMRLNGELIRKGGLGIQVSA